MLEAREDAEPASGDKETVRIARLFEGVEEEAFARACAEMRPRPGLEEAVRGLWEQGFRLGIATASYDHAVRPFGRYGFEAVAATGLEVEDGHLTGEVRPSRFMGDCGRHVCKGQVIDAWRGTTRSWRTVAVGDGANDVCMMEKADLAIAIEPCHPAAREAADIVIGDLRDVPKATLRHLQTIRL